MNFDPKQMQDLMARLWSPEIKDNPYNFVLYAFPWGQRNTPLEHIKGPRTWQREDLLEIADHIKANKALIAAGQSPQVFKKATVSGRGPGKTAEISWLTLWNMTCNVGSSTIVTANNEAQLKTRTWAEVGKWHTLAINSMWFEKNALSIRPMPWYDELLKKQLKVDTGYYYANAQLWSEENPDGFAGAHNPLGMLVFYDEASGIPAPIWKVTEGFFTEPVLHRYHLVYSNGRRNVGPFFECFHANAAFWKKRQLDSRTVEGVDKAVYESIIKQYGADSDEARVEVYGEFPRRGDKQFMARDAIQQAVERPLPDPEDVGAPLVMGVDVARFGDDESVIRFRCGRDARSIPPQRFKGLDNMALAHKVAEAIDKFQPDAVCIDAGNGTGVIDRLREMKYRVHEIWFGGKPDDEEWFNKRTEMWARMREWLNGGCLPNDAALIADLAGPEYDYFGKGKDKIGLETKDHMKDRGLGSPDDGDALALTFAVKVSRKDKATSRSTRRGQVASGVDCGIFSSNS